LIFLINLGDEIVERLIYVECVLKEILRHAPIIQSIQRTITNKDVVKSICLSSGDIVFDGERFLFDDKNLHPQKIVTFEGGHCCSLGQYFARF